MVPGSEENRYTRYLDLTLFSIIIEPFYKSLEHQAGDPEGCQLGTDMYI